MRVGGTQNKRNCITINTLPHYLVRGSGWIDGLCAYGRRCNSRNRRDSNKCIRF